MRAPFDRRPTSISSSPPSNPDNLCQVFAQKPGWFRGARAAEKTWGLPIPVGMAFVHRESSYIADARPERQKLLWVIPWRRPSSAYGYAQATDEAWSDYLKARGNAFSERDDMRDALDFVGWYNHNTHRRLGIAKNDAYHLYLAYHEGPSGYASGRWRGKANVKRYASIVDARSKRYAAQFQGCEKKLKRRRWLIL